MSKSVPFTVASLARAIKGVERAGSFVVGMKPDGTLLIAQKPLDVATLVPAEPTAEPPSKWERLAGCAAQSEDTTPLRAHDRPRRRRGGGWGYFATVDDPKVIESYRAAGLAVYEDGELEDLIRKSPMGKREIAALGGFFRAGRGPANVKGAGFQITSRLVTRGFIEIAESHGKVRKHRITAAGEAEWLRLTNSDDRADHP